MNGINITYEEQIDKLKKLSRINASLGYWEDAEFFTNVKRTIDELLLQIDNLKKEKNKNLDNFNCATSNYNKPIICQILGVEIEEKFYIACFSRTDNVEFVILEDGTFRTNPPWYPGAAFALLQALDHPEKIMKE